MKTIYLALTSTMLFAFGIGAAGATETDARTHPASSQKPLVLTDSELDDVYAGAQYSSSAGFASALIGQAFSMSVTRSITTKHVSFTMSRSVARASGIGATAHTVAVSGIN